MIPVGTSFFTQIQFIGGIVSCSGTYPQNGFYDSNISLSVLESDNTYPGGILYHTGSTDATYGCAQSVDGPISVLSFATITFPLLS